MVKHTHHIVSLITFIENTRNRSSLFISLNEWLSKNNMIVYRIGKIPYDEERFFVAPDWKLWVKFYPNEPIFKIETKKLYLPLTSKSFNSWDELRNNAKNGKFTDKDLSYIYPEESGLNNFEQYEIKTKDIISKNRVKL